MNEREPLVVDAGAARLVQDAHEWARAGGVVDFEYVTRSRLDAFRKFTRATMESAVNLARAGDAEAESRVDEMFAIVEPIEPALDAGDVRRASELIDEATDRMTELAGYVEQRARERASAIDEQPEDQAEDVRVDALSEATLRSAAQCSPAVRTLARDAVARLRTRRAAITAARDRFAAERRPADMPSLTSTLLARARDAATQARPRQRGASRERRRRAPPRPDDGDDDPDDVDDAPEEGAP